jgi:nitrate reductase (cytochrome), electron transfer subunit
MTVMARRTLIGLAAMLAFVIAPGVHPEVPADDPAAALAAPQPSPRLAPPEDPGSASRPAGNPTGPRSIPHRIDGHQLDRNDNRCLACHGIDAPAAVRATPIPPTHLLDRDGQQREQLAGGRNACTICHVPQQRISAR